MAGDRRDEWIVVTEDAKTLPVIEILTGRGFITGKSGSGKSVAAGTMIDTATGRKPIEAVTVGEEVLSLDTASAEPVYREVRGTLEHEAANLIRIIGADGRSVIGTTDHSFLTETDDGISPIRGDALTPGMKLPIAAGPPSETAAPAEPRWSLPSDRDCREVTLATSPPEWQVSSSTGHGTQNRVAGTVSSSGQGGASAQPTARPSLDGTRSRTAPPVPTLGWTTIERIEPVEGCRQVYDLDVAGTDTFIANGIFVHNSNTASVIAEELLERGYGVLIVDTEGEYYGLKEEFELLHAGGDESCDITVGPDDGDEIASLALEGNMPVVLDVSGYFDTADAEAVIESVVSHLYQLEGDVRKPFLLMVEELQEYLPQQGGGSDLADLLERIAKRGRKRGIGLCGISQRPSSVDKDFITQCDWMVWHRLTWETDLNVVRNILGSDRANDIPDFDDGQAILMTDWDDTVETVRFKRKRTLDAGATPGLDQYEQRAGEVSSNFIDAADAGAGTVNLDAVTPSTDPPTDTEVQPADSSEPPAMEAGDTLTIDPESSADAEEWTEKSRDELIEAVTAERQRADVLAAEVEELRELLQGVDTTGAPTQEAPSRDREAPTPPRPPRPPVDRTGVGGNLIEFGALGAYLAKLAVYRCRRAMYAMKMRSRSEVR